MRRELTDAEWTWAEGMHWRWSQQCKAEGLPVPPGPIDSVMQAALIGLSRLDEAEQGAIEQAQRQLAEMAKRGKKSS